MKAGWILCSSALLYGVRCWREPSLAELFTRVFCVLLVSLVGSPATRTTHKPFVIAISVSNNIIITTFNNGSLGSGIDEERSEMRYVV